MGSRKSRRVVFITPEPEDGADPTIVPDGSILSHRTPTPAMERSRNSSIIPESELEFLSDKGSPGLEHSGYTAVLNRMLVSYSYTLFTSVIIVYAMLGDDMRLLTTRLPADDVFYSLSVFAMVVLVTDCGLRSWIFPEYRWSLAFYLDVAANMTILADVGWIWDRKQTRSTQVLKSVGQASRVASRASTFIKIVRFIRMMRVIKMYGNVDQLMHTKTSQERQLRMSEERKRRVEQRLRKIHNSQKYSQKSMPSLRLSTDVPAVVRREKKLPTMKRLFQAKRVKTVIVSREESDVPPDSRISRIIVHRTVQQVFAVVFFTSMFFAFSGIETYVTELRSYDYGLHLLEGLSEAPHFVDAQKAFVTEHANMDLACLIYLEMNGEVVWRSATDVDDLRPLETVYAYTNSSVAILDIRKQVQVLALMSLFRTLLFCGLLLGCSALLIHDFNVSVIYALERMLQLVKKIANDPLLVLRSEAPLVSEQQLKNCCCCTSGENYGAFELQLLENTFRKIGVLLALGFGTAGCDIISLSIRSASSLDPLIPGRKVFAVFSFISIHNFDRLAIELRQHVLVYVNQVAKVVHSVAETYQGYINKNLGEAFLLVWKFNDDDVLYTSARESLNPFSPNVQLKTTLSLIASIKILAKLARSRSLQRHAKQSSVSCDVSIGLHVGWAFEGPIGSNMKIDATYISPHVNLASRVESVSKQYQVLLATSEEFAYRLDESARPFLRHIDTVTLKGVETPMQLFCLDLSVKDMGVSKGEITKQKVDSNKAKLKSAFEYEYFAAAELITQSSQVALMRVAYTEDFFARYKEGLQLYLEGNWPKARQVLKESCLEIVPDDGPCQELLSFMRALSCAPPALPPLCAVLTAVHPCSWERVTASSSAWIFCAADVAGLPRARFQIAVSVTMEGDPANEEGRPYEFLGLLGRGAFGKVYRCLDRETREQCAVKIISKAHFRSELTSILNEVRILSSLNHENIVKFREVRQSHNHVYIEMELLQGGTLQQALGKRRFADAEAAAILKGVMRAVAYLHSKDIIHRDLKPANIIFTESPDVPRVKVTDFGLSAKFAEGDFLQSLYQSCGTMSYMAPEQATRRPYSRPADIWSCGIVMYMLLEGFHPLLQTQVSKEVYIEKLQKPEWTFTDKFSPLARDLFTRMVAVPPLERYTAEEVLQHPWVTRGQEEVPRRYWERMQAYNDQCKFSQIALKCCALAVLTKNTELPVGAYARLLQRKYDPPPKLIVVKVEDAVFRNTVPGFLSPQKPNHKRSGSTHTKGLAPSLNRLGVSPAQSPNRQDRNAAFSRAKTARFVK